MTNKLLKRTYRITERQDKWIKKLAREFKESESSLLRKFIGDMFIEAEESKKKSILAKSR